MTDLLRADPYSEATRVTVDATPLAVIRHEDVRLGEMDDLFDEDYARLNAAADAGRFVASGPPLAVYHGDPQGSFDLEIGVPVSAALDGVVPTDSGTPITAAELPGGVAAVLTHIGSYSGLGGCWSALARAADATPTGAWAEVYVTEPGLVPVERLRTDLFLYVED